jgi:hypothetical protein
MMPILTVTAACFDSIGSVFHCVGLELFGSTTVMAVAVLAIMAFLMYKMGVNMATGMSLSAVLVFALFWITGGEPMQNLLTFIMLGAAAVFGLALFRYYSRGT